ncbi:unnamed protein product [Lepeophtheirus salmonis]|uniref:(salmon louse) hypothetical protein n=1 Tax=Lepeophtheirus salmonis TaxID=72036 RepID=A0A7R8CT78_LEPSM|nr:unnamed protein product [Lepeophtheirus salmonis]CAF2921060.1 unnamed protein product [Lepeophtheirus salmonis]
MVSSPESTILAGVEGDHKLCKTIKESKTGNWSEMAYAWKRDCLSIRNGLLFCGTQLVIPIVLHRMYLDELHLNHKGIVKMKMARGGGKEWTKILRTLSSHAKCAKNSAQNPPSEFTPFPPASEWERTHIDYAKFNGRFILIIMDPGSKCIEAWKILPRSRRR